MNGRDEERLIQLAFGDLPEDQHANLEQALRTDSAAAGRVAEYRRMRDGLKVLGESVPEPQISLERVRDAILERGLRRRNPVARWSWILAPGLTAVLAVAFTINKYGELNADSNATIGSQMPEVVAAISKSDFQPKTELTDRLHAARISYSFGKDEPASRPEAEPETPKATLTVAPTPAPPAESYVVSETVAERTTPRGSKVVPSQVAGPSTGDLTALDDVAKVPEDQQVVMVDEAKDGHTGAQRATEVGTTSDVLVGG